MDALEKLRQVRLPFADLMGIDLVAADRDHVTAEMVVREDLCTAGSVIHGGAVMALADTLGALATVLNLPEGATGTTTIESKTNFIGPAAAGSTVVATATAIHKGRRTQIWQTRIRTKEGRLVAVVTQTQLHL
ncbi:MAG: PaaI family thioesterase [Xanthobacteraceae bacterium]|nr:PaaI family thioesterase [Xanthobacteraceae bacterium]